MTHKHSERMMACNINHKDNCCAESEKVSTATAVIRDLPEDKTRTGVRRINEERQLLGKCKVQKSSNILMQENKRSSNVSWEYDREMKAE